MAMVIKIREKTQSIIIKFFFINVLSEDIIYFPTENRWSYYLNKYLMREIKFDVDFLYKVNILLWTSHFIDIKTSVTEFKSAFY